MTLQTNFNLFVLPLILPLILGGIILKRFRQYELSRMAGIFTLKPILMYPLWYFFFMDLSVSFFEDSSFLAGVLSVIPAIFITILIFARFRNLFSLDRLAWLFLVGDILRWLNTILFMSSSSGTTFYVFLYVGLSLPSLYAVIAFIIIRQRFLEKKF